MLYDPKWEAEIKPAVRSLAGFIAWLEQQNPRQAYDFTQPNSCAVAQYLKAAGENDTCLFTAEVQDMLGSSSIVSADPQTFGAALERARLAAK